MRGDGGRFSIKFWLGKIFLLGLLAMLSVVSWWLWDYDADVAEEAAVNTTSQQQTTPATQTTRQTTATPAPTTKNTEAETPVSTESSESSFPFSFDGKNTADGFPGIDESFTEFTYACFSHFFDCFS